MPRTVEAPPLCHPGPPTKREMRTAPDHLPLPIEQALAFARQQDGTPILVYAYPLASDRWVYEGRRTRSALREHVTRAVAVSTLDRYTGPLADRLRTAVLQRLSQVSNVNSDSHSGYAHANTHVNPVASSPSIQPPGPDMSAMIDGGDDRILVAVIIGALFTLHVVVPLVVVVNRGSPW